MTDRPIPAGEYAPLNKVRLGGGNIYYENRERDLSYLKLLDPDRMLYNFRAAFGVDTRGAEPPGGWEEPDGLLRGHSTGHFLSALSMAYSATGDDCYREKLEYMVSELRSLQLLSKGDPRDFKTRCTPDNASQELWSHCPENWGEGYLSAYSPDQFALLEQLTRYKSIWAPYYTLHKILAGMLECYERTGLTAALDCAKGIGSWVYLRLSALSPELRREMWSLYIAGEYGGMNESMARLGAITGDAKYSETAKMFDNDNIFPGLSRGEDVIHGLHANQHIPQMIGAHREYLATGDEFYESVAREFFRIVTDHHMYAIGGVGKAESFFDSDALAANIDSDKNCETCAAYNLMKTARELYAMDPEKAEYMDYYERAMINQILASQNPDPGPDALNAVTYMLPIGPGAHREYSDNYNSFTCCHGTGMENHVKYPDASFFISGGDVYINQYVPAELNADGLTVRVESDFPFGGVRIHISGRAATLRLRIPLWCGDPFGLPVEGRYAVLRHAGGETSVSGCFAYSPRIELTPDKLDGCRVGALMFGPFVMVEQNPSTDWQTISAAEIGSYELRGDFALVCAGREFVPIYKAHGVPYHVYFKII